MDPTLVEILDVLAPYATTLVVAVAGFFINRNLAQSQRREERIRDLEAKLRNERIAAYNTIIEPYILILSSEDSFKTLPEYRKYRGKSKTKEEAAFELIGSVEYKRAQLQLSLFGSDKVTKAFNQMMQHSFKHANSTIGRDPHRMLQLFGEFLVGDPKECRK